MTLQEQIDDLLAPSHGLGGLVGDRTMLALALRLGTDGGKRFRPWLFRTVHQRLRRSHGLAQAQMRAADRVAAAIELVHTAFVIHDDVIDNDDMRRGRSSVPGWFRASGPTADTSYAHAGGILTGDLALVAAVRGFATCGASPAVTEALLDLLDATMQDSAAGELADVRLSSMADLPTFAEALSVSELKTASYSFVLPMRAGAILAEADPWQIEQVTQVGRLLGIAFQLRDDLIGMFADETTAGKDPLGDLREGKRTPLIVHAAQTSHWWRIEPHLGDPNVNRIESEQVRRALLEAGSVDYISELIAQYVGRAHRLASAIGLDDCVVSRLTEGWDDAPQRADGVSVA